MKYTCKNYKNRQDNNVACKLINIRAMILLRLRRTYLLTYL